jgi:hypothetical protein
MCLSMHAFAFDLLHLIYCNQWLTQNSRDSKSVLNGFKKKNWIHEKKKATNPLGTLSLAFGLLAWSQLVAASRPRPSFWHQHLALAQRRSLVQPERWSALSFSCVWMTVWSRFPSMLPCPARASVSSLYPALCRDRAGLGRDEIPSMHFCFLGDSSFVPHPSPI